MKGREANDKAGESRDRRKEGRHKTGERQQAQMEVMKLDTSVINSCNTGYCRKHLLEDKAYVRF